MAEEGNGAATAGSGNGQGRVGANLPKDLKVMIAIPAYGRTVYVNCAMGLANLIGVFAARRVPYRMHSVSDAVISRARNLMAAEFLADEQDWTHLVMIDADVGFNPRDLLRMIAFNKDVVGCALPKRQYDTSALPERGVKDWAEAEAYMSTFTAEIPLQDGSKLQSVGGFVQARYVATAIMVIKRQVFETMIEKKAAAKITPDVGVGEGRASRFYGFFEPIIDPETNTYLAEDFSFCRRWREQCGGEVWCDIQGEYAHTGTHDFKGNLLKTLQARGARAEVVQQGQVQTNNG